MNIIDRVKNIITTPKTEWEKISTEETTMSQLITTYVVPLALIPALATFIGNTFIGISVPLIGRVAGGIGFGIEQAIIQFVSAILGVILTAFVINLLAPSFASEKNINKAAQLVAYSFTPVWLGGILMIYPPLGMLGVLFGIYGLYLLYIGFPKLMKTPEDKVVIYLIISIVLLIVIWAVIGMILAAIFMGIGLGM